jgi:hypothetical protein
MTKQDMQNTWLSPLLDFLITLSQTKKKSQKKKNPWRGWAVDRMTNHWPSRQNQLRTVTLRSRERKKEKENRRGEETRGRIASFFVAVQK